MLSADQEWEYFLKGNTLYELDNKHPKPTFIPKASDLYISTQTKIAYLNQIIDLNNVFWKIPVIPYQKAENGVIKKQIKINCDTKDESNVINELINKTTMIKVDTIKFVDNPKRRIKYKDVRKINIGLCKKDLIRYRMKTAGAFYNCFVTILRIKRGNNFKEVHVKVFNTGKLEIPGIQTDELLFKTLDLLLNILQPYIDTKLSYNVSQIETVLINSNFNCNYLLNRDKLFDILKYKYKMHVNYDPCSYPGIQVKYYYNQKKEVKENEGVCSCVKRCTKKGSGTGENQCREMSFMVFRTGSVLVVGNCDLKILYIVYNFIKKILIEECNDIKILNNVEKKKKKRKKKIRKKIITLTNKPVNKA